MKNRLLVLILGACLFTACGPDTEKTGNTTKEEAALQGGKSDSGVDLCASLGWYGDGVCDDFCPKPDPDCTTSGCADDKDCSAGEVCTNGTCEVVTSGSDCGGFAGFTCAANEYCDYNRGDYCGAADATGVCAPKPGGCDDFYDPVCGCDGQTYGNACEAHSAGTDDAADGVCGTTACSTDSDCASGEQCKNGVCEAGPQMCSTNADCAAGQLCNDGICGNSCGGFGGFTCDANEYCDYERGDYCGAADATGICKPQPVGCDLNYDPVCGCDGQTYGNACEAYTNGTDDAADGECPVACNSNADCSAGQQCENGICADGPAECSSNADCGTGELCNSGVCKTFCGGFAGFTCEANEWCNYDDLPNGCGIADGGGYCEARPDACDDVVAPVCGCNGQTYTNECEANANGVDILSNGPC